MAPKRKASDMDLSDADEEPMLGRQVLPVANLPHDYSGEPMDGLQYLFTVRRNARKLPHYTRVANPYEIREDPVEPATSTIFLGRFRNFRRNSAQPTIHVHVPASASPHKIMPEKKQRDQWWAFIEGRPQTDWDPPKKPQQNKQNKWRNDRYSRGLRGFPDDTDERELSYDYREEGRAYASEQEALRATDMKDASVLEASGSLPTPFGTPAPQELSPGEKCDDVDKQAHRGRREPTPSLMQYIDHRYALHLLMYFTHWINVHLEQPHRPPAYFTHTHARWIFILLSRVEDYVSADETSLLRNLARACMSLIKENMIRRTVSIETASPDEATPVDISMDERSCWLIITAIVGIWGQRDLWVDAEEMLANMVV
ncbi:hypothetical protein SCP_0212190 [Sparassis crispa]|uniref:Survival motor neuron interacting protein n=1 Tax=Sparassis crispa TaxID=139825 RepID=A0A401GCX8_9APHY|nr:hypothetical protein SCP_0212190 [Sparassis crispa]GBE80017.1 hypothetical protein SCP_0212190 [Sparassis crispa]